MFQSYRKERAVVVVVVVVGLPSLSCLNPPVTAKLSVGIGHLVEVIWRRASLLLLVTYYNYETIKLRMTNH